MMKNYFFVLGLILFIFSCGNKIQEKNNPKGNTKSQQEDLKTTGETNYQKFCVSCHGSDGKLGVAGAKDLPTSIMSQQERELIIRNGKGSMPAFGTEKMTDLQVKDLAEYTFTLK